MIRHNANTEPLNRVVNYRRVIVDKLPTRTHFFNQIFIDVELRLRRRIFGDDSAFREIRGFELPYFANIPRRRNNRGI